MLHDLSFDELEKRILILSKGSFAKVVSATDFPYSLKAVKSQNSLQSCTASVITINGRQQRGTKEEFNLLETPQVLISGEIHGDERVGPPVTVYIAELLTHSARCELEDDKASCTYLIDTYDLSPSERVWLAFLATRRESILVPTGNCMGYLTNTRYDVHYDPNRDFGYSRRNKDCLQSTTAKLFYQIMSKNLIQIVVTFHGGMVAIGYEWGSPDHNAPNDQSPDDNTNIDIATHMRTFAGSFAKEKLYPIGRMNSLVYPVEGGMEDWMYAAGWSKKELVRCNGLTRHHRRLHSQRHLRIEDVMNNIYSEQRSMINSESIPNKIQQEDVNNRAAVFLIETSDQKRPSDTTLGTLHHVLDPTASGSGHISRNIRLGLVAIDSVQPYVCFSSVTALIHKKVVSEYESESKSKSDTDTVLDSVSSISESMRQQHTDTAAASMSALNRGEKRTHLVYSFDISWYIGGAYQVDHTWLSLMSPPSVSTDPTRTMSTESPSRDWPAYVASLGQPFTSAQSDLHAYYNLTQVFSGPVHSSSSSSSSSRSGSGSSNTPIPSTLFSASVRFAHKQHISHDTGKDVTYLIPGEYWLVAWSVVDQQWGKVGQGYPQSIGPQTHLANARTNESWYVESPPISNTDTSSSGSDRRVIRGRKYWPSDPQVLKVSPDGRMTVTSVTLHCAWWRNEASQLSTQLEEEEQSFRSHSHQHKHKHPRTSRSIITSEVAVAKEGKDEDQSYIMSKSQVEMQETEGVDETDSYTDKYTTATTTTAAATTTTTTTTTTATTTAAATANTTIGTTDGSMDSIPVEKILFQLPVDETRSVDSALTPKFTHGGHRVDSQGTSLLLITLYLMFIASAVIVYQLLRRRWSNQRRRIIEIKPRSNSDNITSSVIHEKEYFTDFNEQIKPLLNTGIQFLPRQP